MTFSNFSLFPVTRSQLIAEKVIQLINQFLEQTHRRQLEFQLSFLIHAKTAVKEVGDPDSDSSGEEQLQDAGQDDPMSNSDADSGAQSC